VRLIFADDGQVKALQGAELANVASYEPGRWYDVGLNVDVGQGTFDISFAGKPLASAATFAEFVKSVERISFRTGPYRDEPTLKTATADEPDRTSPNPDLPEPVAIFHIDDVTIAPTDLAVPTAGASAIE
jgi:hypothetical protein